MTHYLYLVLLVVTSYSLSRSRSRLFSDARDTYNKLMVGLLSWGFLLLISSLTQTGLINHVTILSRTQYRYPIEAVLLVGGGIFIITALVEWLPRLVTARDRVNTLQAQMQFTNDFLAALKVCGSDIRQVETAVKTKFQFQSVEFTTIDRKDLTSNQVDEQAARLSEYFDILASGQYAYISSDSGPAQLPVAVIPIRCEANQVALLIGTWPIDFEPSESDLEYLQLAANVLLARGYSELPGTGNDAKSALAELRDELVDAEQIPDQMRKIYESLRKDLEFDLLRIAIFDQRGYNVTQHCLAGGKSLLSERDRSISTEHTQLGVMFREPELTFCGELGESIFEDDRWLASCGQKCALTFPITSNKVVVAAVTIASQTESLNYEVGELIEADLTNALLPMIKNDIMSHQLISYNRQIIDLTAALRVIVEGGKPREIVSELLDMLVKKIPTTYCRLWKWNSSENTLEFIAESASRELGELQERPTVVSLDRARWHRQAVLTGRLMVMNEREERSRMDEEEESLTLINGSRSALIIPLVSRGKTIGVISLVELRRWERNHFSLSETLFARALANIVAQVVERLSEVDEVAGLRRQVETLERRSTVSVLFNELPSRLSTPLTSILARTDQLIGTVATHDEAASIHLLAIKRQTEKIVKEVRDIQEAKRSVVAPMA